METTALTLILFPVSLLTLALQYLAIMRFYNQDQAEIVGEDEGKDEGGEEFFLKEEALDNLDLAYKYGRENP